VPERVGAAGGLADDLDPLLLEQVAQARAEQVVVVDQEDPDRVLLCIVDWRGLVQLLPPSETGRRPV
jgi:hypothetical protein